MPSRAAQRRLSPGGRQIILAFGAKRGRKSPSRTTPTIVRVYSAAIRPPRTIPPHPAGFRKNVWEFRGAAAVSEKGSFIDSTRQRAVQPSSLSIPARRPCRGQETVLPCQQRRPLVNPLSRWRFQIAYRRPYSRWSRWPGPHRQQE